MAPLDIKVPCNTLICPKGTYVWGLSKPDNLFYVRILSPSLNVIHLKRETPNMISLGLYQNNWPVPKISWGPGGQTLQIIFLIKKSHHFNNRGINVPNICYSLQYCSNTAYWYKNLQGNSFLRTSKYKCCSYL